MYTKASNKKAVSRKIQPLRQVVFGLRAALITMKSKICLGRASLLDLKYKDWTKGDVQPYCTARESEIRPPLWYKFSARVPLNHNHLKHEDNESCDLAKWVQRKLLRLLAVCPTDTLVVLHTVMDSTCHLRTEL